MTARLAPFRAPLDTWPGGSHMWVAGSKQWVDPLDMSMSQIEFVDISLALSHICRYTGHVEYPLTVAEHSVNVMLKLKQLAEREKGYVPDSNDLLAALLHDAAEAYLSDLPKPIKSHPSMAEFSVIEDRLMELIYARFGIYITDELAERVKAADHAVFLDEWKEPGGKFPFKAARVQFVHWFNHLQRERIYKR